MTPYPLSGTTTTWNGSSVAKFDTPSFDWQGQRKSNRLYNDGSGTLAHLIKGGSGDITYTMTYDKRNQLLSWDTDRLTGTESSYSWDSAGNPASSGSGYDGQTFDTNSLNEIDPTSGTSFGYDNDGNLTSDAQTTYTYDTNNRLIKIEPTDSPSDGDYRLEFKYDYLGRRVEKSVEQYDEDEEGFESDSTRSFKYVYRTGTHELLMELHIYLETPERSYHWGIDKSDSRRGAGGAQGLLMVRDYNGTPMHYYPAYDFNGNVAGLLDDNGDFKAYYEYDAFGKIVKEGGTYKDKNPFRFSTQYTDEESGLVYYGHRYYDPAKGRFLNRDPVGQVGGLNLYRFVGNNPANRLDYLGLWCSYYNLRTEVWEDCGGLDPSDFPPEDSDDWDHGGGGNPPDEETQKEEDAEKKKQEERKRECDEARQLVVHARSNKEFFRHAWENRTPESEIISAQIEADSDSGMRPGTAGFSIWGIVLMGGASEEFEKRYSPAMVDLINRVELDNTLTGARLSLYVFTAVGVRFASVENQDIYMGRALSLGEFGAHEAWERVLNDFISLCKKDGF